jgi:hypothetical protein
MAKKVNKKAVEHIHGELRKALKKDATPKIAPKKLDELKLDISGKFEVGNLLLQQDLILSDKFSIKIIDKMKDWDGLDIVENVELVQKAVKLFKQGEERMTYDEFLKLKIKPTQTSYKIGDNIKLTAILFSSDYSVGLQNEKKDPLGRWRDDHIDVKKVREALEDFKLTKSYYRNNNETSLNKHLGKHFQKYFENVKVQSGNRKGIFDLEFGDLNFVIEIKMASTIKSSKHGASGQIAEYLDKGDNVPEKKFLVLVAGLPDEEELQHVKGLKKDCKTKFKCHYEYLEAK